MNTDLKKIGKRILEIRTRLKPKVNQIEFGAKIGVSGPTVSNYEKGETDAGAKTLALIATIGGVSLDWLITGKDPDQHTYSTAIIGNETIAEATVQGSHYAQKINLMVADMDEDMQKDICLSVEKEKLLRDLLRQKDSDEKAG